MSNDGTSLRLINLPVELIDHIILRSNLDERDLGNFSQVCTLLNDRCQVDLIWKVKFTQRFTSLSEDLSDIEVSSWRLLFKARKCIEVLALQALDNMPISVYYYKELKKSHLDLVSHVMSLLPSDVTVDVSKHCVQLCLLDVLRKCINAEPSKINLTRKYFGSYCCQYLVLELLKPKIQAFTALPEAQQLPDAGAALISGAMQAEFRSDVMKRLSGLASEVLLALKERHPDHPALRASLPGADEPLSQSLWDGETSRVVVDVVLEVLLRGHHLRGNREDYRNLRNSILDQVLDTGLGNPLALSVIFQSVCRRLGVAVELIAHPSHVITRFVERPNVPTPGCFTYCDLFYEGRLLRHGEVLAHLRRMFFEHDFQLCPASAIALLQRMLRNFMASIRHHDTHARHQITVMQLRTLFETETPRVELLPSLLVLYAESNYCLDEVLAGCAELKGSDVQLDLLRRHILHYRSSVQKRRPRETEETAALTAMAKSRDSEQNQDVGFYVGMIMRHKRFNYRCVIYKWDATCQLGHQWQTQMGVYKLPRGPDQPFYGVLVEDGSFRYAAQENLEPEEAEGPAIEHDDIGRYFCQFTRNCYTLNRARSLLYPEDAEYITQRISLLAEAARDDVD